jgi:uncharacterized protein (DUF1501 family)
MLNRRGFIQSALVGVAAGIYMPHVFVRALGTALADGSRVALSAGGDRTLIVVQLAGGNDGLNTVVPYQDGRYYSARPTLAVRPETVLPLSRELGLNPALAGLGQAWADGRLAVVGGVGYDHPSLSHFEAMDIWQTADPERGRQSGWLASIVAGAVDSQGHPLGAVALGARLPPALCCPPNAAAVVEGPESFRLAADPRYPALTGARQAALDRLYRSYRPPAPYAALFESAAQGAAVGIGQLHRALEAYRPAVDYPETPLGSGLKLFAALIEGGLGLRVGYIVQGGYDTHAEQARTHEALLRALGDALGAFYADLAARGRLDRVLVLTWSEFGRRVAENGSRGTDHGTAAPMFLLGGGVKGGLYGPPPDLGRLENGNLRFEVDFRTVYATVLEGWLGADAAGVLGRRFPTLPLLG